MGRWSSATAAVGDHPGEGDPLATRDVDAAVLHRLEVGGDLLLEPLGIDDPFGWPRWWCVRNVGRYRLDRLLAVTGPLQLGRNRGRRRRRSRTRAWRPPSPSRRATAAPAGLDGACGSAAGYGLRRLCHQRCRQTKRSTSGAPPQRAHDTADLHDDLSDRPPVTKILTRTLSIAAPLNKGQSPGDTVAQYLNQRISGGPLRSKRKPNPKLMSPLASIQLARWVGKRRRLLERLDRLVVEKVEPARLIDRHVAQAPIGLELHPQLGVAVAPAVDHPGWIALAVGLLGVPVLGHLALDAVEEGGEPHFFELSAVSSPSSTLASASCVPEPMARASCWSVGVSASPEPPCAPPPGRGRASAPFPVKAPPGSGRPGSGAP